MIQKLKVTNLYKIFGNKPNKALTDLKNGKNKDQIFSETGHVVGVMDASFSVNEGEIFVIMGLSGSGKSTLVRMLNRLIEPTSGEVILDGTDILQQNKKDLRDLRRKKISMVFQSFALMPHMTVIDNVAFGLELAGLGQDERIARSRDALKQVGLIAYERSMPTELSGGQQQRVGLARALANDPEILLMDEAFSALDPIIRTEMQDELLRLQSEHKRTIIFISHDLDEALRIGDRIAIMRDGLIVQIDTPRELANNPADDYVRNFFEKANTGHLLRAIDMIEPGEKNGAEGIDENMSLPDVVKTAATQGLPLNVLNDTGAILGHITQQNLLTNLSEQA
ncbi:quaternary amine ABC transporter ATP-binding protein [Kiloniella sp.]|uniref:quaternary amine ABC transporter ATP-binding protein n=1 Tax=Kiloniella sp. TaxID=1938587 RepID=UPI003B02427B